jgi:rhodanese-related sulfurtransferase
MIRKPPLYVFGWIALVGVIFVGSFVGGRTVRTADVQVVMPELVRNAHLVEGIRFVTAEQVLQASASEPVIIDVRTSGEYAAAHIAGAMNIQDFQLPDAAATLPGDRAWVLYCTCPDDRLAKWGAAAMQQDGFPNALVLQQGFQAWQDAGGPIIAAPGSDIAAQGCGCNVEAEANKLFVMNKAQEPVTPGR